MAEHQDLHLLTDYYFIKPTLIGVLCWNVSKLSFECVFACVCTRMCQWFYKNKMMGGAGGVWGRGQVQCVSWILKATSLYILSEVHLAQFISPQAAEEEELVGHTLEPDSQSSSSSRCSLRHASTGGALAECHDFSKTSQVVTEAVVSVDSLSRIYKVCSHILLNPWRRDSAWIRRTHQSDIRQREELCFRDSAALQLSNNGWMNISTPNCFWGASW